MQRRFVVSCLTTAALLLSTTFAGAQPWPAKPARVLIPFPAGPTPDVVTRVIFDRVGVKLQHPFASPIAALAGS